MTFQWWLSKSHFTNIKGKPKFSTNNIQVKSCLVRFPFSSI